MKHESKEKVYAERQNSYKQEKEKIFKEAIAAAPKNQKKEPKKEK